MNNREHIGVLVLAVVVSLGAVGIALFTVDTTQAEKPPLAVVSGTQATPDNIAEYDTDQDGIPDWKEALLGTDPQKADSDDDGLSDNEELLQNADPLVFGTEPKPENSSYVAPRGLPTTEALAREVFSRYAELKNDGSLTVSETNEALAELVQSRLGEARVNAPVHVRSELTVESDVSLDAYESSLIAALNEASRVREYELNVFARAVSENKNTELAKLRTTAIIYQSIRERLLTLEVPTRVADDHLALVNALAAIETSTMELGRWTGDPLDALVLVNNFSESETSMRTSMSDLFTRLSILKKT